MGISLPTLTEIMDYAYGSKNELNWLANVNDTPVMITWHWSAGWYHQPHNDYHINIFDDGDVKITETNFANKLPHTWMKNTANIGLSMCCCADATTNDEGTAPPTEDQIESMCKITAVLCEALSLPIDIEHVASHGERADNDDWDYYYPEYTGYDNNTYGPKADCERWDCAVLWNKESPYFDAWDPNVRGETYLRNRSAWYRIQWYGH